MRLTNNFDGVDFFVNNNPRKNYSFYIGVSYNNLSTHQLLNGVSYFLTEGLKGQGVEYEVQPLEQLREEYGDPKGYIFISDSEIIRKIDNPYTSRPVAYVRVSFSV